MAKTGKCVYCSERKPLVRAHAIPRALLNIPPQSTDGPPELVTNKAGTFPKRVPIGVYDSQILCARCEATFSEVDDYGARILLQETDSLVTVPNNDSPEWHVLRSYNYSILKRFFMAVLWRASVSEHDFYSKVQLGPYEARLAAMLRDENPGTPDDFAVVLWIYDPHPVSTISLDPFATRVDDIHCYRFKLNRYVFWIKADKRPYPKEIREIQLKPTPPLIILHSPFADSQDHKLARALVTREIARRRADYL
jgi:hypothetical protein